MKLHAEHGLRQHNETDSLHVKDEKNENPIFRDSFSFVALEQGICYDYFVIDVINKERTGRMKIGIGNDHSALELKAEIMLFLKEKGHEVVDYGTNSEESCDYPVYGEIVGKAVASGEVEQGILICGTGLGISLAANKVQGIRAAVCSEPYTARMARQHNNCNILAFGARVVGAELAKMIVETWLETEFEGGRHQRRVDQIMAIEQKNRD